MITNETTGAATVTACTRAALGSSADEVTAWRTERYIDAGFYDEAAVARLATLGRSPETTQSGDYEIVAWSDADQPLVTITMRTVHNEASALTTPTRPSFGFESVHGRAWLQAAVPDADSVKVSEIWELGRFLRDRRVRCSDAVQEALVLLVRLIVELRTEGRARFLVGEVEPEVALSHIKATGVPVTVGPERHSPHVDGLLAPRYVGRTVVPFVIDLAEVPETLIAALTGIEPVAA